MLANSSHYHHNVNTTPSLLLTIPKMSKLPFPQRALNNIKSFEDQAWPHFSPILTQNSLKTKTPKKFQYKDDNLLSDKLSLASTSPSLTSLSPSPSSESFSLTSSQDQLSLSPNEEEGSTTKKKRKRKCVLKVGYKKKLKTEVCKFWAESGSCPYGDQCAFAHGKDEIRDKIHTASNYKSRRCAGYHDNGVCMYGTRCHFVHSLREDVKKNEKLGEDSSENDMENVEIWCNGDDDCVCKRRRNRIQRLPCFSNFCEY